MSACATVATNISAETKNPETMLLDDGNENHLPYMMGAFCLPSQPSRVTAMSKRSCAACGKLFVPRPQIHNQQFCSDQKCQRERRRRTQAERRANKPATPVNDAQYRRDWRIKNSDYWKHYRASHPEYAERNRIQQRQRNKAQKNSDIAKDDVWPAHPFTGGLYRLSPVTRRKIANEAVWIVEISVLSGPAGLFWG